MNYRHDFHAGNYADVTKHALLALIIGHLRQKPKPFRVIDTHAGSGLYDLGGEAAARTGEWRGGIGRLMGPDADPLIGEAGQLLAPYLGAVAASNDEGGLSRYPGSPLIIRHLLRAHDRLVANEPHPEDGEALRRRFRADDQVSTLSIDGYAAIRSLLPPKERRGLLLVDPPFEEAGEIERLLDGLSEAARRFATGTVMMWYPIKDVRAVERFRRALTRLRLEKLLVVELKVEAAPAVERLHGSGLVILNPPFMLADQLAVLMPALGERFARGPGGGAWIDWLGQST